MRRASGVRSDRDDVAVVTQMCAGVWLPIDVSRLGSSEVQVKDDRSLILKLQI